ncbi:uncharacterized protein YALI1_C19369g [Yarrowia lipolytica]|uniref:Uncharacterized protein n=1 Tax=Yarrowia lipolytica TaxID=4952 RepID=A0A1D8NB26_YARLL|nr:hypothetical protein YALI1_C19369g [Yarrowia lipolytica]
MISNLKGVFFTGKQSLPCLFLSSPLVSLPIHLFVTSSLRYRADCFLIKFPSFNSQFFSQILFPSVLVSVWSTSRC